MTKHSLIPVAALFLVACSQPAEPLTERTAQPGSPSATPDRPQGNTEPAKLPSGHPPVAQGTGAPAGSQPPGPPKAGGLTWTAGAPLVARAPASSMRAAEYAVSGADGEAVLTVFYFGPGQGGSVQDNLDRWIDQVSQPDGKASKDVAKVSKLEVAGMPVTRLDVSGTFGGGMAPMMGQNSAPQENQRVLGAIVEGPQGPVFFKMTGPAATVQSATSAFDAMVASMKAQ